MGRCLVFRSFRRDVKSAMDAGLAALLIGCIALYFRYAPTTPPVIHPAVADTTQ